MTSEIEWWRFEEVGDSILKGGEVVLTPLSVLAVKRLDLLPPVRPAGGGGATAYRFYRRRIKLDYQGVGEVAAAPVEVLLAPERGGGGGPRRGDVELAAALALRPGLRAPDDDACPGPSAEGATRPSARDLKRLRRLTPTEGFRLLLGPSLASAVERMGAHEAASYYCSMVGAVQRRRSLRDGVCVVQPAWVPTVPP